MSAQPMLARPLSAVVTDNIRAEAARRKWSQADVARCLGLSRVAVSERHRGKARWQLDEVQALAEAFGVPLEVLLRDGLPRLDSNQQPIDYGTPALRLVAA